MKSCFALVWIFIENAEVLSLPTTVHPSCKDPGLWIDGHVACRYLEEESGYGMHNNPEGFCNKYFDKCCLTCTRLKQTNYGKPTTQDHNMTSNKSSTSPTPEKERTTEDYIATPLTKTVVIKPINSFSNFLFGNLIKDLFKTVNQAMNKG